MDASHDHEPDVGCTVARPADRGVWVSGALGSDAERRTQGLELCGNHVPPGPPAALLADYEPGIDQLASVMGDRGLTLGQWPLEIATAGLVLAGDDRVDAQAHRVTECGEYSGQSDRILLRERAVRERGAAQDLGRRAIGHGRLHCIDNSRCLVHTDIDSHQSKGCGHVPCATRPQRVGSGRRGALLFRPVRDRSGQGTPPGTPTSQWRIPHSSSSSSRASASRVLSTISESRSPPPMTWPPPRRRWRGKDWRPTSKRTPRVATHSRTRCGWGRPTGSAGRSTPCLPTPLIPETSAGANGAAARCRPTPPPLRRAVDRTRTPSSTAGRTVASPC